MSTAAQLRGVQQRLDTWVLRSVPQGRWKFITVQFPAADTDVLVKHSLNADQPDEVRYLVVGANQAASVYDGRHPWGADYCFLRASAADTILRLLLFTEQVATK